MSSIVLFEYIVDNETDSIMYMHVAGEGDK